MFLKINRAALCGWMSQLAALKEVLNLLARTGKEWYQQLPEDLAPVRGRWGGAIS